jgi:hypothetical protein
MRRCDNCGAVNGVSTRLCFAWRCHGSLVAALGTGVILVLLLFGCGMPGSDIVCPSHLRLIENVNELERLSFEVGRPLSTAWEYERETSQRYVNRWCQR